MILGAKEGGADAVKFQSYKAEKLASKNALAYWDTSKEKTYSQFELFKKHDKFNEGDYIVLAKFCEKNNIDRSRIIIDPGIGFGKTTEQNIHLIKKAEKLVEGLNQKDEEISKILLDRWLGDKQNLIIAQ